MQKSRHVLAVYNYMQIYVCLFIEVDFMLWVAKFKFKVISSILTASQTLLHYSPHCRVIIFHSLPKKIPFIWAALSSSCLFSPCSDEILESWVSCACSSSMCRADTTFVIVICKTRQNFRYIFTVSSFQGDMSCCNLPSLNCIHCIFLPLHLTFSYSHHCVT